MIIFFCFFSCSSLLEPIFLLLCAFLGNPYFASFFSILISKVLYKNQIYLFYEKVYKHILKHPIKDNTNRSANPPVTRASTILFNSMQEMYQHELKIKKHKKVSHYTWKIWKHYNNRIRKYFKRTRASISCFFNRNWIWRNSFSINVIMSTRG